MDEQIENNFTIQRDENGLYLEAEIEDITREDILIELNELLKMKPIQFPMGDYVKSECEPCVTVVTVHKKQTFCPICFRILGYTEDANVDFDTLFQVWQEEKNFLLNILNGSVEARIEVV